MLPSILAKQLQQGMRDYIETTFPMTNTPFAGSLASLFDGKDGVYHQPYVSVKLPFRRADKMPEYFSATVSYKYHEQVITKSLYLSVSIVSRKEG